MIKCWATVDKTDCDNEWIVNVFGQPPFNYHMVYQIEANSDNDAAQQGLKRFVDEVDTFKPEDRYTCH